MRSFLFRSPRVLQQADGKNGGHHGFCRWIDQAIPLLQSESFRTKLAFKGVARPVYPDLQMVFELHRMYAPASPYALVDRTGLMGSSRLCCCLTDCSAFL